MAISDGVPATGANFNAAFLSRTQDSATIGVITLNNSAEPLSGSVIDNAQQAINELFDADGTAGTSDSSRKLYSSNNYITDGSSRKTALEQLDAALYVVATSASAGGSPEVEVRTLTAPEIAAKEIVLAAAPLVPNATAFSVKGMPAQFYSVDFTVSGTTLSWLGTPLDGVLLVGDIVQASYWLMPSADVENRTVTAGEIAAKQLVLAGIPAAGYKLVFDVQGLPPQFYSYDYVVAGNILDWTGLGLDGVISTGDIVRVMYWT